MNRLDRTQARRTPRLGLFGPSASLYRRIFADAGAAPWSAQPRADAARSHGYSGRVCADPFIVRDGAQWLMFIEVKNAETRWRDCARPQLRWRGVEV